MLVSRLYVSNMFDLLLEGKRRVIEREERVEILKIKIVFRVKERKDETIGATKAVQNVCTLC